MAFEFILKPIVFLDVEEAVVYYEKKSKGLGVRFYNSFLQSLSEIQLHPYNYLLIKSSVRRHIITAFPYKIFYLVEYNNIIIIGVSHAKRSNKFIKARLKMS